MWGILAERQTLFWWFQVVRESQSGAARRRHPQPPAVVQAGTGPPGARGGAGQDDPLPQTGPRYRLFTARNNSCQRQPHLDICLPVRLGSMTRVRKPWHTLRNYYFWSPHKSVCAHTWVISLPCGRHICSLLKVPEWPTSLRCGDYCAVKCRSNFVGRRHWQKGFVALLRGEKPNCSIRRKPRWAVERRHSVLSEKHCWEDNKVVNLTEAAKGFQFTHFLLMF